MYTKRMGFGFVAVQLPGTIRDGYPAAFRKAKGYGGLLPYDRICELVKAEDYVGDWGHIHGTPREVLVHPQINGTFNGSDVVDSMDRECPMALRGVDIPKEVLHRENVYLIVTPMDVQNDTLHGKRIAVIEPERITPAFGVEVTSTPCTVYPEGPLVYRDEIRCENVANNEYTNPIGIARIGGIGVRTMTTAGRTLDATFPAHGDLSMIVGGYQLDSNCNSFYLHRALRMYADDQREIARHRFSVGSEEKPTMTVDVRDGIILVLNTPENTLFQELQRRETQANRM